MRIGRHNLKPILIYLPDEPLWADRWEAGKKHFAEQGIDDIFHLSGIHGKKWGVAGKHFYLADGKPDENFYIGDGKVAGNLTQYISFVVMDALPDSHFMSLEDDCRFVEGWRERLEQALEDVPADFDFLFAGSCCAGDKDPIHVKGDVYEFPYRGKEKWNFYPQCSHCLIIAKKCVKFLIETNRDVANPSDVSLVLNSFPKLKVFAVLPRIAHQQDTELPE